MKIVYLAILMSVTLFAMEPLVSASWLQKHIGDSNLVIIDVSDEALYKNGHIPKSLHSPISQWRSKHGHYLLVKEQEAIKKEFARLGINIDSKIVVYSHHNNPKDILKASYVLWAMEYYGFTNTAMLDGGLVSYRENEAPIESVSTIPVKDGNFQVSINHALSVNMAGVKNAIGSANMLDARPPEFYFGISKQIVLEKAGHIPTAKSYFWRYSFDGELLKNKEELRKILIEGMQLNPQKPMITYCTGGLETSMNFFVLHRVLGFKDIRLYDASMKEWANDASTPMVRYRWE